MRSHLRAVGLVKDRASRASRPSTRASLSTWDDVEMENDYSILFREYFCVAADDLAGMLDTRVQDLGVLYNGILTTGSSATDIKNSNKKTAGDLEKGLMIPAMFGNGQLLFLVRTVDKMESARLATQGYRFAYPKNISEIVARNMRVPHSDIVDIIERLQLYSQPRKPLVSGGTYLACFAIRATVKATERSWDILVPTDHPGHLPYVELSEAPLSPIQLDCLTKLDGLSVSQSITYLNNIASEVTNQDQKAFIERLLDMITELTHLVPENFFKQASFSARSVAAPQLSDTADKTKPPQIFAFSVIPDVHSASVKSTAVTYVPLSFFQCIQRVYKNSPDHAILAQRIHREFGTILSQKMLNNAITSSNTNRPSPRMSMARFASTHLPKPSSRRLSHLSLPSGGNSRHSKLSESPSITPPDGASDGPSEKTLIESHGREKRDNRRATPAFGGIMVSSDTKVEVFDTKDEGQVMELREEGWGTSADVRADVKSESPTYVDELFRIASLRWQRR
jgi:hypothetical protein